MTAPPHTHAAATGLPTGAPVAGPQVTVNSGVAGSGPGPRAQAGTATGAVAADGGDVDTGAVATEGAPERGLPVTAPLGRLPARVRGRDVLLTELRRPLTRRRPQGGLWVLTGMGGIGKSTAALAVAERARARGWRVWWVTATDTASLTGGMLEVLGQLGAPQPLAQLVRAGASTAPGRAWDFINSEAATDGHWLLVFDGADNPAVLAAAGHTTPADGTGWLRPDPSGMVIVTTRHNDVRSWGHRTQMRELKPLDVADAGSVLEDLAPGIPDPGGRQRGELGRRLGGLPLALHLAGTYLASPFARWQNFGDYLDALESGGPADALTALDDATAQASANVTRTWELSLSALDQEGRPQARPLLFLLSCYAPAAPVPLSLLRTDLLAPLLTQGHHGGGAAAEGLQRLLDIALQSLATVGLLDTLVDAGERAVTVHLVVADVNRGRLLTTARDNLAGIAAIAVALLHSCVAGLDVRQPADWPTWRRLVPHAYALLGWLAPNLDPGLLASLVTDSSLIAGAIWRSGTNAPAERLARASVAAAQRLGGQPVSLSARSQFAFVVAERRHGEAEQLFRQLLTDQQRVLGDDHPDTMASRRVLARLIGLQGRLADAESAYRGLVGDCHRLLGAEHPETLAARHGLSRVVARSGRHDEAGELYRLLLDDAQRLLGAGHPECLAIRRGLAQVATGSGQLRDGELRYRRLISDCQRVLGEHHPVTLGVRHELTQVLAGLGRRREAWWMQRRLLADCRRELGPDHPETLAVRRSLRA